MMFENDIEPALQALRNGGVIAYPTDTIWGLGCHALDSAAVQKVYELKRRPAGKSMIVLLADARDLYQYVADPQPEVFDLIEEAQAPLTVIFQNPLGLPDNLLAEDGSIGIRIVRDDFCRHLIKRLRAPLVSTSANFSGEPSPAFYGQINPELLSQLAYVTQYRRDDNTPSKPSSIVKIESDGSLNFIRR